MSHPGQRVRLVPAPHAVAVCAVNYDDLASAVGAIGLTPAHGWPHADTVDALRPLAAAEPAVSVSVHGTFLIVNGDEVVGECGWLGGPDDAGSTEIMFGLARSARGRGLGTAAIGLLAAWAEQQAGVRRLTADVLIGNAPSWQLLERLGFQPVGQSGRYLSYHRPVPGLDLDSASG